eukprot:CAMPEP_0202970250 /NCGR_PEP_ID=MMETSP1396-20130829/16238_1 /ASSEMBLY_ACC=CAM_ASM_000872 /TAXON_ID= /ORGANISM="Pseudokeronopsis sp., Strain Brazil" /LENGTH=49 /DNA_ID=CAMNT_0049698645 /DNA_START=598 /DNA_END=747 /DNA_ORIENTATION=-
MSEHKYQVETGYPTFWSHVIDAVSYKQDKLPVEKVTNAFHDPKFKNKAP